MSKTKLTFEQRCRMTETCLPELPSRAMLVDLHDEMLARIAELRVEVAALKQDAARYNVIRLEDCRLTGASHEEFDAAIDAAKGETK